MRNESKIETSFHKIFVKRRSTDHVEEDRGEKFSLDFTAMELFTERKKETEDLFGERIHSKK